MTNRTASTSSRGTTTGLPLPPLSRRRLLGTGAALTGGLTLGGLAPGAQRVSRAAQEGRQFQGQIVITIQGNPHQSAQQALVDAYRAVQPGVEVIWEVQDREPAEYTAFLGTQLAAGDIRPDVVSGNYVPTFRGYVNFDQYRRTVNPYTGNTWDVDLNWDFSRAINASGERIMLPTRAVHITWFYNEDLFAQAGVMPPTTWANWVEVCAKLREAGITPIVGNFDYQIPQWFAEVYFDQYHTHWVETVRAQPGDWNYDPALDDVFQYDPDNPDLHNTYTYNQQRLYQGIRDGTLRFDTPEVAEIVRNMAAIFPRYATEDFFVIQDPYPVFLQQQAAIMPSGTWSLNSLKQDLESLSPERLAQLEIEPGSIKTFTWSTFENPPMESELVKSPVRSVESSSGEYLSIVEKSQEQTELVVDFLLFWTSPPGYQPYLDALASAPTGFSPAGPLQIRGAEDPPEIEELFAQIQFMGNAETNYNGLWTSGGEGNTKQDLRGLFQRALEGELSPDDYATRLQAYFTDNLDAFLESAGLTEADLDDPSRQPGT
jgi:ABC-type glycerol-3-phosphate transport system substrate-binding protein